jgi:hypothetical protein
MRPGSNSDHGRSTTGWPVRKRLTWLALGMVAWPASTIGQDAEVRGWIEQLGDTRYHRRQAATQRLLQLGDRAIPWLQQAIRSPDDEVRTRATQILETLQASAFNNQLIQAATVRLKYDNEPLHQVLADAAKQLGVRLKLTQPDDSTPETITLDTGEIPWWQAVVELCQAANLHCKGVVEIPDARGEGYSEWALELEPSQPPKLPSDCRHAWLIRPRLPRTSERSGEQTLVHCEAISTCLHTQAVLAVVVTTARDDQDHALAAAGRATNAPAQPAASPNPPDHDWQPPTYSATADFTIQFHSPDAPLKQINLVEGVLILRVVTSPRTLIELDRPVQALGQNHSNRLGFQLRLLEWQELDGGMGQLRVQLTAPSGAPISVVHQPRLVLFDPQGEQLKLHELRLESTSRQHGGTTAILVATYHTPAGQPLRRLEWIGPATATVEVPFRLANIPIE